MAHIISTQDTSARVINIFIQIKVYHRIKLKLIKHNTMIEWTIGLIEITIFHRYYYLL